MTPRAVFLDGGGTIVVPDRGLVTGALRRAGVRIDPRSVPHAHYETARTIDREGRRGPDDGYGPTFCAALGVPRERLSAAVAALAEAGDRRRSGKVLWSEPTPGAIEAIVGLRRAGLAIVIVTNSDGHAAENLRAAGILDRVGLSEEAVVDSEIVGSLKPDGRIFEVALAVAGISPAQAVHVGDLISTDVAGARAMGITPIHLDPYRRCRRHEHRHVRSLRGIWAHLRASSPHQLGPGTHGPRQPPKPDASRLASSGPHEPGS